MSDLNAYLIQKREALAQRIKRVDSGELGPQPLKAVVSAAGRSGIRKIRIRDFQVLTDSPPDFAGYDLGPGAPELQLGVLGSCLTHSYLIQAAALNVPIDSIEVELEGVIDPRSSRPGHGDIPVYPQKLAYTVRIASSASPEQIVTLEANVGRFCPILNLLKHPQEIKGRLELTKLKQSPAKPARKSAAAGKSASAA